MCAVPGPSLLSPHLSCVFVVEEGRQLSVQGLPMALLTKHSPGCPGENQETSSKNLNVSCRQGTHALLPSFAVTPIC